MINFICPKHKYKGVQKISWSHFKSATKVCKFCCGKNKNTDDFKKELKEISPSIEIIGEYNGSEKPIMCKCLVDGHIWSPIGRSLLYGQGCPVCGKKNAALARTRTQEEFVRDLKLMNDDIEIIGTYINNHTLILCRCKIDGCVWYGIPYNLLNGSAGCPSCTESKFEKKCSKLLTSWGFQIIKQYRFDDCKDIYTLPFDFYLPDFNILIEADGADHYYPINRGNWNEEELLVRFEDRLRKDIIKTDFCNKNNIPLIRIPYWELDDDNLEYYLFDNLVKNGAIEEIKSA